MAPNGSLSYIDLNLAKDLQDEDFRNAFFEEISSLETAEQIRELRLLRGKTQAEVAVLCDMKQPAVSRLEQPDYGKWNYQTLVRIARALGAQVEIRLRPSEEVVAKYVSISEDNSGGPSVASSREFAQPSIAQKIERHLSHERFTKAAVAPTASFKSIRERSTLAS